MDYRSKFFGQDIFQTAPSRARAFVSTYQSLGYMSTDTLSVLEPVKHSEQYIPNYNDGSKGKKITDNEALKKTIAYYQCASWMLSNRKYNSL
ncbi:hypothetical protein D3C85_1552140 [compost metagenome]